jgi:hypothetical protein
MDESTKGGSPVFEKLATTGTSPEIVLSELMLWWCLPAFHGSRPLGLRSRSRNQARGGWGHTGLRIPNGAPTSNHVFRVRKTMVVGSLVRARHPPL